MARLKLVADPTFKGTVNIPVPGSEPSPVEVTFKHRTKTALGEFVKSRDGKSDTDSFLEVVTAWDLEAPFTRENVEQLIENYPGAWLATFLAYIDQLQSGKTKNSAPSP